MSCTELGLSEYGLRLSRSDDREVVLRFPSSVDFTGYTGTLAFKSELDDASALLTITDTATAAESVIVFSANLLTFRVKRADTDTLPENPTDAAEPWEGWCELIVTDPAGLVSRLFQKAAIVERGAAE